jgi:hypothetical protein
MSRKPRILSKPSATILRMFVDDPRAELFGFQILKETGIPPGTLYPALRALAEDREFLLHRLEDIDPVEAKRPARRLYRLNIDNAGAARAALAEVANRRSTTARMPTGSRRGAVTA